MEGESLAESRNEEANLDSHGRGLNRPECVLAHESGRLFVSDWSGGGGIAVVNADGSVQRLLARDRAHALRPNGIALEEGGSFLLAHLGEDEGGIFRLQPDGSTESVLTELDGRALPPSNFVTRDGRGRIWVTVSTTRQPRALGYRSDVADGFILLIDDEGARLAADGLGYTNECALSPDGTSLFVNETFARRTTVFDVGPRGDLHRPRTLTTYGPGTFPDGLAFDREGALWITSVVSNRVIRVSSDGKQELVLEENDPRFVEEAEAAFLEGRMGRPHLDRNPAPRLRNISSLAFGGRQLERAYLGCLLGNSIRSFIPGVQGLPPVHWHADLTPLLAALASHPNEELP